MRAAARAARAHLGRRGAFLLIIGTGKTCYGLGFLVDPPASPQGLQLLTDVCSLRHWAWLWIGAGIITAGSAWLRIGRDWAGYVAALVPPMAWATAYTAAVITGDYSRGLWVAIWYLTSHVGVIMWAASVPEFEVPPLPPRPERGET